MNPIECFETGKINFENTIEGRAQACAVGLMAWGNVCAGFGIPPKFGEVMAQISMFLGILGTPESFSDYQTIVLEQLKNR